MGVENMRIVCEFSSSCFDVLHENSCSENFQAVSQKNSLWGPDLIKLLNEGLEFETVLRSKCFPGRFPKF